MGLEPEILVLYEMVSDQYISLNVRGVTTGYSSYIALQYFIQDINGTSQFMVLLTGISVVVTAKFSMGVIPT